MGPCVVVTATLGPALLEASRAAFTNGSSRRRSRYGARAAGIGM